MTKTKLLTAIDKTIKQLRSSNNFKGCNSGPLPLCRLHDIDCMGKFDGRPCPASTAVMGCVCSSWKSRGEEFLYFCFVRAMVEEP